MRIDVHAHYYPQSYIDLLIELGRNDLAAYAAGQSTDFTQRLKIMDECNTDIQILSSIALDTLIEDEVGSVRACRFINDAYKEVIDAHGGRFGAFGQVPLPHVESAIAEAERCLDQLDFQGICMPCFYNGAPLDSSAFEPFWAAMNKRGAVIYVHPVGTHSCDCHGMADYGLHTAYGSPLQLSVAATRLVFTGLTKRYPDLKFIFAVCGGFLPYWWTRLETNLHRGLKMTAVSAVGSKYFDWIKDLGLNSDDPMAPFRRFWYDTSVQDVPDAMRCVKNAYGADRLLLGSDEIFGSLAEAVRYIEENEDLTAEEKHAILDENAQALLQLPRPIGR
jgi:aminocarboxymuconate-semialdehyde decarboxylase